MVMRMRFATVLLLVMCVMISGCGQNNQNMETVSETLTSETVSISEENGSTDINEEVADGDKNGEVLEDSEADEGLETDISEKETVAERSTGAWKVRDEINAGWNLGNSLSSYYNKYEAGADAHLGIETLWGNPKVTQELIDYVASLGFNTIRIPITWYYNCGRDENGHLVVGEQWMARTKEVVGYAINNNMRIIINTMCDAPVIIRCGVTDETEWNQVRQDVENLWRQIAEAYADYDDMIMFEAFNEPDNAEQGFTYSDLSAGQLNELNQLFVDTVRSTGGNNETRILLVPTLFQGTLSQILDAFTLPEDSIDNALMASVHCYESEFDQDIEWKFEDLEAFSDRINAPVIITEFGANDQYELGEYRTIFTSNYVARASKHGIKCCIWDDGAHWQIVDRDNLDNTNMDIMNAIFEGVNGMAYENGYLNKITLDNIDDFYFGSYNLETGKMDMVDYEHKYWATLTSKTKDNRFLEIPECDYVTVSMITRGDCCNFWIYYMAFLDEDMNMISYKVGKSINHRFLCNEVPKGAKYLIVNSYDPFLNHKQSLLTECMSNDELAVRITYISKGDGTIEKVYLNSEN